MPFSGFVCEADGSPITPDHCLACARNGARPGCHMTAPVVKGILDGMRPEGFGLTVTLLLSCARKARLMQEVDYRLKPSEAWWAYRGQLMHGIAAEYAAGDPDAVAETRFSMLVGDQTITGQPDLVLIDQNRLLDYKTTKRIPGPWRVWACPQTGEVIREGQFAWRSKWMDCPSCGESHIAAEIETVGEPRPYRRHVEQVSLYRLLMWESGIAIEMAEICYQDMATQLRVPVDLLPLDEARALLEQRVALFTQGELPNILTDPDDLWECDWCPVRARCEELHGGPVGKAQE